MKKEEKARINERVRKIGMQNPDYKTIYVDNVEIIECFDTSSIYVFIDKDKPFLKLKKEVRPDILKIIKRVEEPVWLEIGHSRTRVAIGKKSAFNLLCSMAKFILFNRI